jgi:hypothetical protein
MFDIRPQPTETPAPDTVHCALYTALTVL